MSINRRHILTGLAVAVPATAVALNADAANAGTFTGARPSRRRPPGKRSGAPFWTARQLAALAE